MSRLRSIIPRDNEIDDVLAKCFDEIEAGSTQYPGMTYEEGIIAGLDWIFGMSDLNPIEG